MKEKELDMVFQSLSDLTRRSIIRRIAKRPLTISEIAKSYSISLPAVSKHVKILEQACLIQRRKQGREHIITIDPIGLKLVEQYIAHYKKFWERKLDSLQHYLEGGDS